MNCHHCGSCIAEDAVFCPNCGIKLQAETTGEKEPIRDCGTVEQPLVPQKEERGKGFAVAGMICGIVSIFYLRIITGALGLIFGLVARHKGYKKGMSTAGIVCGSVGLGIGLLLLLLGVVAGLLAINTAPYAWDFFEEMTTTIISELM